MLNRSVLLEILISSQKLNTRFPSLGEKTYDRVLDGILEDTNGDPMLFGRALDDLCRSSLNFPASRVEAHLKSVRVIDNRKAAINAIKSESSTAYYLAALGLTMDSDPAKILSTINYLTQKTNTVRVVFDKVRGGLPVSEIEAKRIRSQIYGDIKSLSSIKRPKKITKTEKRKVAPKGQLSFSYSVEWLKENDKIPANHPMFDSNVLNCAIRLAIGLQDRKVAIDQGEAARVAMVLRAVRWAYDSRLSIKLTSCRKILGLYIQRPYLATNPDLLEQLRDLFQPSNLGLNEKGLLVKKIEGSHSNMAVNDDCIALCVPHTDPRSAFPYPDSISMAFSFLNLDPSRIYSQSQILSTNPAIPHSGEWIYPEAKNHSDPLWHGDPISVTKKSRRILINVMRKFEEFLPLNCANS